MLILVAAKLNGTVVMGAEAEHFPYGGKLIVIDVNNLTAGRGENQVASLGKLRKLFRHGKHIARQIMLNVAERTAVLGAEGIPRAEPGVLHVFLCRTPDEFLIHAPIGKRPLFKIEQTHGGLNHYELHQSRLTLAIDQIL